jgi:hypothetical protein
LPEKVGEKKQSARLSGAYLQESVAIAVSDANNQRAARHLSIWRGSGGGTIYQRGEPCHFGVSGSGSLMGGTFGAGGCLIGSGFGLSGTGSVTGLTGSLSGSGIGGIGSPGVFFAIIHLLKITLRCGFAG